MKSDMVEGWQKNDATCPAANPFILQLAYPPGLVHLLPSKMENIWWIDEDKSADL